MKKAFVSLVAVAALAASAGGASVAAAAPDPDPDANGDLHSNCHTGSKFQGAGGDDRFKLHGNGEGPCVAAPVAPPSPAAPAVAPSAPAAAVVATPRVTG
jgi:hypothetical protein